MPHPCPLHLTKHAHRQMSVMLDEMVVEEHYSGDGVDFIGASFRRFKIQQFAQVIWDTCSPEQAAGCSIVSA